MNSMADHILRNLERNVEPLERKVIILRGQIGILRANPAVFLANLEEMAAYITRCDREVTTTMMFGVRLTYTAEELNGVRRKYPELDRYREIMTALGYRCVSSKGIHNEVSWISYNMPTIIVPRG